MKRHCPHCGQDLPECPVCRVGVERKYRESRGWIIDDHQDKADRDCKGAGLDYRHTIPPYPKGAA